MPRHMPHSDNATDMPPGRAILGILDADAASRHILSAFDASFYIYAPIALPRPRAATFLDIMINLMKEIGEAFSQESWHAFIDALFI